MYRHSHVNVAMSRYVSSSPWERRTKLADMDSENVNCPWTSLRRMSRRLSLMMIEEQMMIEVRRKKEELEFVLSQKRQEIDEKLK